MTAVSIETAELARDLDMTVLETGRGRIAFTSAEINRPGLQFAGYYEYFAEQRVQLVGNAEVHYLFGLPPEELAARADRFMSAGVPCVVCARNKRPPQAMLSAAAVYGVPVFCSELATGEIGNRITQYLQNKLAPCICIHGVLMNVFGVGVLLRGPSGIGKSETALELIKNGHQLVADDVVAIKRIAERLVGSAPDATRNLIEIRGIGLMDVRHLYGVGAVQPESDIDLVMDLELWNEHTEYNRIGGAEATQDILGVRLPSTLLPVSPGRNLSAVVGVAARQFRLRRTGYEATLLFPDSTVK